jgi:hypothetical protein
MDNVQKVCHFNVLIPSSHVCLGLPLGCSLACHAIFGYLSLFMQHTWPNHLNCDSYIVDCNGIAPKPSPIVWLLTLSLVIVQQYWAPTRSIFMMEHTGMPFWKFFLRRMQTRMAYRNLFYPSISINYPPPPPPNRIWCHYAPAYYAADMDAFLNQT